MTKRPPLTYFDPEHVDRPVPGRPWRAIVLGAVAATLLLTAGWELFWRGKGLDAGDFRNTEGLWAQERRKAVEDATVIIGSSRIFFDIDLDVWEGMTGVRPIQLALEGTSPRIFLKDLAADDRFHGLVIVGVTAPLFFGGDGGFRAGALDHYRQETPSERWDHVLSMQIEKVFAFIDDQSRPKRQVEMWPLPLRAGMQPRFDPRKLESLGADRNAELWDRVVSDERYREEAKRQWVYGTTFFAPPPNPDGTAPGPMPPEAVSAIVAEVKANIDRIRARGGDVAFMRLPYEGAYTGLEDNAFPRAQFWDRLVRETASAGVSWHDHEALQGYYLPEWSHIEARDAERYTRAVVPIFYRELELARGRRSAAR